MSYQLSVDLRGRQFLSLSKDNHRISEKKKSEEKNPQDTLVSEEVEQTLAH